MHFTERDDEGRVILVYHEHKTCDCERCYAYRLDVAMRRPQTHCDICGEELVTTVTGWRTCINGCGPLLRGPGRERGQWEFRKKSAPDCKHAFARSLFDDGPRGAGECQ